MKIQTILVSAMLSLGCLTSQADPASVVVTDVDGSTTRIVLDETMQGEYILPQGSTELQLQIRTGSFTADDNGNLVPDSTSANPGKVLFAMPVYKVRSLDFQGVTTSVEGVGNDNLLTIDLRENRLVFRGVTTPVALAVCTLDGTPELSRTITADIEIDLADFGPGVHVVKAGEKNFKILIR